MLIEFRVKNFRSFKDETVLSLVASQDKSLPGNKRVIPSFGSRSLLHSAVLYGANASGKTNLFTAIEFFNEFVNLSATRKVDEEINTQPFLFSNEHQNAPSEFEITFIGTDDVRYQYGLQVNRKRVVREWLIAYPKGFPQTWFEREHSDNEATEPEWYFGRKLKGNNQQIAELTRKEVLFLSNAASLNHNQIKPVFTWFRHNLRTINVDEIHPILKDYSAKLSQKDEQSYQAIRNLLNFADLGIDAFEIQEEITREQDLPEDMPAAMKKLFIGSKQINVLMAHLVENQRFLLPLDEESAGTQRFFALGGPLVNVLEQGQILFIDELDASLHPLLVRYLVELFHSPESNPHGAQLIFNTHDITLMDTSLFRRDQIWFLEKDRSGCSHLYPLLDFSPRKDEALAKGYLKGRYGAIPFLGDPQWGSKDNGKA